MSFESSLRVASADERLLGSDWRSVWVLHSEAASSIAIEDCELVVIQIVLVDVHLDLDDAEGLGLRYLSWIGFWACAADISMST